MQRIEAVQGKGGKSGVGAEKTDQQRQPDFFRQGQPMDQHDAEKPHQQRSADIDHQGAERKTRAQPGIGMGRNPVAADRPERTAGGDGQIQCHDGKWRCIRVETGYCTGKPRQKKPNTAVPALPSPPVQAAADARSLPQGIVDEIRRLAHQQGFEDARISRARIDRESTRYPQWLERHYHGEMGYMARNVDKRLNPPELVPGTLSIVCLRMNYLPEPSRRARALLDHPSKAYVSRYALGRDYHKLIRKRLQAVARALAERIGDFGYRVFTDSAPVLERSLAVQSGLGWRGKHSCLLTRQDGSWFFLGEIFTDLPLPPDPPVEDHCGSCTACIDACPTDAIVEPYIVDARRCISYLTIEHHSAIPVELRPAIGNRIYGCDDCQIYCPWNRFEQLSPHADFQPRHGLDDIELLQLFGWSEQQFLDRFAGSPIRRIGYASWRRNLAVALGNAAPDPHILHALEQSLPEPDPMVAEHLLWALQQQQHKLAETRP